MSPAPRSARSDLLVELGTEELPPKALRMLERALAEGICTRFAQAGLVHGAVESFATPRRLAVRVRRLAAQQPEQQLKRRGPPVRAAFDAQGQPTRAAQAFAASCGVSIEALGRERDAKGNDYLQFTGVRAGTATVGLLPGIVQEALDALPTPKRMRWGAGDAQFVRPVHWLVFLYGGQVVPTQLLGVTAGDRSYGHRFMSGAPLRIRTAASYELALLTRGRVIADFGARRERIREQVLQAAAELGGRALINEALLDEVTALVEWPVPVTGQFEPRFLKLPREVLISTLQDHQRYFAIEDATGSLLPRFITISNIDSPDSDIIRAGNERVVRPRLSDAAFFWEQDVKQPLAARRAGLDAVTFQAQLGSLGARTARIRALATVIATTIGADATATARAAELCKCDLLTAMVGEFPELQGTMGRYYALADGEAAEVACAVQEHYLPRGAGDALPGARTGSAVALADKLDVLAGIFAIGQKPSGTRDPFGLRRAAIGMLRIVLEQRLELDLVALIGQAVRAQPLADINARASAITDDVYDYIIERLRGQYLDDTSATAAAASTATPNATNRITTEMFDAVLALRPASLLDFDARLRALRHFLGTAAGASLAAANKRIANILKKSGAVAGGTVSVALLRATAEIALHASVQHLRPAVEARLAARDYAAALSELAQLRTVVDHFFDQVLVNDPDLALRHNRLVLLDSLHDLFGGIADLSRLPG